jgi:hypothetical protein
MRCNLFQNILSRRSLTQTATEGETTATDGFITTFTEMGDDITAFTESSLFLNENGSALNR